MSHCGPPGYWDLPPLHKEKSDHSKFCPWVLDPPEEVARLGWVEKVDWFALVSKERPWVWVQQVPHCFLGEGSPSLPYTPLLPPLPPGTSCILTQLNLARRHALPPDVAVGPRLQQTPELPLMMRPPTAERIIICLLHGQVPIWWGLNTVSLETMAEKASSWPGLDRFSQLL